MIEDTYKQGRFLRRWSLVAGWPTCLDDALDTTTAHPAAIAATEAENARIRAAVEAVEAYEAALLLSARPEPPALIPAPPSQPDAPPSQAPNPDHAAWTAARELVSEVAPAVLALHRRRMNLDLEPGEERAPPVRVALVQDSQVLDVRWVDADWTPPAGVAARPWAPGAAPGGAWSEAGGFVPPPPPPPPVPTTLRLLPFLGALAQLGWITAQEALDAARTGAVPAAVEVVFAQLPAEHAFQGRLAWAAMVEVDRANPLLASVAAANGRSTADLDAVFRRGAEIAAAQVGT